MKSKAVSTVSVEKSKTHTQIDLYTPCYLKGDHLNEIALYPFCVEESIRHKSTWFKVNRSDFMMQVFLLKGKITYFSMGEKYVLTPEDMLIIPNDADYEFQSDTSMGVVHKMALEFKGTLVNSIASSLGFSRTCMVKMPDSGQFLQLWLDMRNKIIENSVEFLPQLLGMAYESLVKSSQLINLPSNQQSSLFAKAQARLEAQPNCSLSLEQLSEELRCSKSTLNRLFRKNTGYSVQNYRILRRLEAAKELLKNSSLSVKEIAYSVGYCNQYYFTNEFKRVYGYPPSTIRHVCR